MQDTYCISKPRVGIFRFGEPSILDVGCEPNLDLQWRWRTGVINVVFSRKEVEMSQQIVCIVFDNGKSN
jgi:hypothetical protein